MCGIFATFGENKVEPTGVLTHRGPDESTYNSIGKCHMYFYRLAINDLTPSGSQPFNKHGSMLICNGEIYNHKEFNMYDKMSTSDCECIMDLIKSHGIHETCMELSGDFAFVWSDGDRLLVARDPIGVRPLFYGIAKDGTYGFASEIKVLKNFEIVDIFPPGCFYDSYIGDFTHYFKCHWSKQYLKTEDMTMKYLKGYFRNAVEMRIESSDREVGFLLSGGLDSSLVVGMAKKLYPNRKFKTFSIGTEDSPDLKAARQVADFLGTEHYEVPFDFEEGIRLLPDIIKSIESYDITTIRASTPMWILCRWISKNTDCKVILSGEGSDELFGGYKYFKNAPSLEHFQAETTRRMRLLHQFDVLRADRCTAAHGLELRVPFLDKNFVDSAMSITPELKFTLIEKDILRQTFQNDNLIPDNILFRTKDAFSDAVGYNWVDTIKERLPEEENWYRKMFGVYYPNRSHVITEIWRPRWTTVKDPSARKL